MKSIRDKPGERCEHCRELLVRTRVQVYRYRGGRHVLFKNVPALQCRVCGQRVFEAPAIEAMENALEHPTGRKRKTALTIISA